MLTISFAAEMERFRLTLNDFQRKQLPFAAATALTRAAYAAQGDLKAEMASVFDRPVPFTLNSTRVEIAKKTKLEANVHFRDWAPKGVPAGRYLRPQIMGGPRSAKSHERALRSVGAIPDGYFLVPTKYADIDANGNMSAGQIVKIMSSLRAFSEVGYTANRNSRGASRGKRKDEAYFSIRPGMNRGGLPPGIYKVIPSGFGRIVVPVLAMTPKAPSYRQRFDFDAVAMRSYNEHAPRLLGQAIEDALRTARP